MLWASLLFFVSEKMTLDGFEERKNNILRQLYTDGYDKSPKGSVDDAILDLIHAINQHKSFVTTSSCSGRVTTFLERGNRGRWIFVSHDELQYNNWDSLKDLLFQNYKIRFENQCEFSEDLPLLSFKFEPFILHIECADIKKCEELFKTAYNAGFRNSGMMISLTHERKRKAFKTPKDPKFHIPEKYRKFKEVTSIEELGLKSYEFKNSDKFVVAIRTALKLDAPLGYVDESAGEFRCFVSKEYIEWLCVLSNQKFKMNMEKIARFTEEFMKIE
jgi:tRNA wybutosine-synthesizing protein 3